MSKQAVKLTLVEMYAIKHALQKGLPGKRMQLELAVIKNNTEDIEKFEKDIVHEEALAQRFEREIRDFREKNNIK